MARVLSQSSCCTAIGIKASRAWPSNPPTAASISANDRSPSRLTGPLYPEVEYQPVSVYPDSRQDFSLLWPTAETYARLEETLDDFEHPLVQHREFLLDYKGTGLEPGTGSYTFRYWLAHPDRTLTGSDLEGFRASFLGFLADKGIQLR